MDRTQIQEAVGRVLEGLMLEGQGSSWCQEYLPSPICIFDLESYELLVARNGKTDYPNLFSEAIRSIKSTVTLDQLDLVISAVKRKRSQSKFKNVRTRIEKMELAWVEETASKMQTKSARVIEAVLFIYLRAVC